MNLQFQPIIVRVTSTSGFNLNEKVGNYFAWIINQFNNKINSGPFITQKLASKKRLIMTIVFAYHHTVLHLFVQVYLSFTYTLF